MLIRGRYHYKFLKKKGITNLEFLKGRKLVYFPLQQIPESSTTIQTPYFTNQLAIILELALSLPIDAVLLVKEHIFQLGRREMLFYKTLLEIPNVYLVDPRYEGLELIKDIDVVCTITSTTAYEAAALGKYVLSFHDSSVLEEVPHVTSLKSLREISKIGAILHQLDDNKNVRKVDGERFFRAMHEFCFDLPGGNIIGRDTMGSNETINLLSSHLISSLKDTPIFRNELAKDFP